MPSSVCIASVGKIPIDAGGIISAVIYENFGFLNYGKLSFIDKTGFFSDGFDFKAYSSISMIIASKDADDKEYKSSKSFTGDVVSFNIKSDSNDPTGARMIIELIFIDRGVDNKLLSSIQPSAYPEMTSVSAIGELCKSVGIKSNIKISNANDSMNWLIVNHNLLSAINFICDHSYINGDDAIFYHIDLKGSINVDSLSNVFNSEPKSKFHFNPIVDYINIPSSEDQYFNSRMVENNSGILQEANSVGIKTAYSDVKANTIKNKNQAVSVGGEGDRNSVSVNGIKYVASRSPNTHDLYGVAPSIRTAVFASYPKSINLTCSAESRSSVGDVIEVLDGVHLKSTFEKSPLTSGKYMIMRKAYHFNIDGNRNFTTLIHAIKNNDPVKDSKAYTEYVKKVKTNDKLDEIIAKKDADF